MNAIVHQQGNLGALPTAFQGQSYENDLGAGVQGGFGLIGYKGKVWSIRHRGEERTLMRDDGDGPRSSIEVVIVKAPKVISKIWYQQGYVEGSSAAPDCFSTNGVTPDAGAVHKQSPACASCPKNQWGSRITPQGKAGKECQDSKRLAVVPLGDIMNESFGGPMLLRVPAASLQDMASYAQKLQSMGYPYFAVGTRIAFDHNEAYPKFVFGAIRVLTEQEASMVLQLQADPQVERILSEAMDPMTQAQAAQAVQQPQQMFEQPPQGMPQQFQQGGQQWQNQTPQGSQPSTGATSMPSAPIAGMTGQHSQPGNAGYSAPATGPAPSTTAPSQGAAATSGFGPASPAGGAPGAGMTTPNSGTPSTQPNDQQGGQQWATQPQQVTPQQSQQPAQSQPQGMPTQGGFGPMGGTPQQSQPSTGGASTQSAPTAGSTGQGSAPASEQQAAPVGDGTNLTSGHGGDAGSAQGQQGGQQPASQFEMSLDDMLGQLLPAQQPGS